MTLLKLAFSPQFFHLQFLSWDTMVVKEKYWLFPNYNWQLLTSFWFCNIPATLQLCQWVNLANTSSNDFRVLVECKTWACHGRISVFSSLYTTDPGDISCTFLWFPEVLTPTLLLMILSAVINYCSTGFTQWKISFFLEKFQRSFRQETATSKRSPAFTSNISKRNFLFQNKSMILKIAFFRKGHFMARRQKRAVHLLHLPW